MNGQVQGPGSLLRRKSLRCPLHTLLSGPHRQSGDAEEDRFLRLSGTKLRLSGSSSRYLVTIMTELPRLRLDAKRSPVVKSCGAALKTLPRRVKDREVLADRSETWNRLR